MKMNRLRHGMFGLGLAGVVLFLGGCQTGQPTKATALDNSGFMSLWESYSHCRQASDVGIAMQDVKKLTEATELKYGHDGFVLPLPSKIEQLVTNPTNRFAVDVRSMASACSLHAGQLALEQGHINLARDLFAVVLALHSSEESSYYRLQAKAFLAQLERGIDISLKSE